MRDRRLSDDYASLIFKYCDEHSDFVIKQLANLVKKSKSRVIFNKKKKQIRTPQKTEVKLIKSIKNLETNRKKNFSFPE